MTIVVLGEDCGRILELDGKDIECSESNVLLGTWKVMLKDMQMMEAWLVKF